MSQLVYLDNNSTTKLDDRVLSVMMPFLTEFYGNASSSHYFGTNIRKKINEARSEVANFISALDNEIIFTSGATESINIAIKGLCFSNISNKRKIITVATEHKAVLDTYKFLEHHGFEVIYLPVNRDGLIDLDLFKSVVDDKTLLVSVMYVNNETGVIQDIKALSSYAKELNSFFFCDATQAAGKININTDYFDIDLLCFSGHKFHGPKGIGALYISNKSGLKNKLYPLIHGGGHENGLRSGTTNSPAIVGLAKACNIAKLEMKQNKEYVCSLRNELEKQLLTINNAVVNGNINDRIYNTTNICFQGQDANVLIGRMKNFAISNGSACTSLVIEPSHVLKAMGISDEDSFSSIRFSLSKYNGYEDIEITVREIKKLVEQTE